MSSNGSPHDTVSDLKRQKDSPHDEEVRVVVGDWSRPMYADVSSNGSPHEKVDSSGWFSTQELEESVVGSTHTRKCVSQHAQAMHFCCIRPLVQRAACSVHRASGQVSSEWCQSIVRHPSTRLSRHDSVGSRVAMTSVGVETTIRQSQILFRLEDTRVCGVRV